MWKKGEKQLLKDKYIGPLIKKYGHCRIQKEKTSRYFIDLVDSICGQQLSIKAADTIFNRIKEGLGKITPENILKTKDTKFRSWGLSRAKTTYVKDLARKVKENKVEIKKLDLLDDEKIREELIKVKGIGPWTADMFLMFTLARPDIFPVEDLGIRNGIKMLLKKELDKEQMIKFAERWSPNRTLASWYIWKSLENS